MYNAYVSTISHNDWFFLLKKYSTRVKYVYIYNLIDSYITYGLIRLHGFSEAPCFWILDDILHSVLGDLHEHLVGAHVNI